jgi:hypothetical protein
MRHSNMFSTKTKWFFALALTILIALSCMPRVRDEVKWRLAELRDTKRAYETYADSTSVKSPHRNEAYIRACDRMDSVKAHPHIPSRLFWWWMWLEGSPESCAEYLDTWPTGAQRANAWHRLDQILWTKATKDNTIVAYLHCVSDYDSLAHAKEAERRLQALKQDSRPFDDAEKKGTADAWWGFLDNYPGHRLTGQALAHLAEAEPNSVFRLARNNIITLTGTSDAIDRFGVVLDKGQRDSVAVLLPPGAYWKAEDPEVRDAVATGGFDEILRDKGEIYYHTRTALVGMHKRPVTYGDTFTLLPTPPNEDLARLIAFFQHVMPDMRLRQAAVWIATDDATFSELQKYMDAYAQADLDPYTGEEDTHFGAEEAINAIQIVEAAGFDLHNYAIWSDREEIFWDLLSKDSYGWSYLANSDSAGIGRQWDSVKTAMAQRVAVVEPRFHAALRATPVEVELSDSTNTPNAAWLAWYLRKSGVEVDIEHHEYDDDFAFGEDANSDSYVSFNGEIGESGQAIADIVQSAFSRSVAEADSYGVTLNGGSLSVSVFPKGANDAQKEREAWDQIPRLLSRMWRG